MYEYYTINHVALITGLTSRTIRSHMKQGLLTGEQINGVWHFTAGQVASFMAHPSVVPSIKARRNALVYDFLLDEYKRSAAMCTIIDRPATLAQANLLSEFLCHTINTEFPDSVRFGFSFNGSSVHIILSGSERAVQSLVSRCIDLA